MSKFNFQPLRIRAYLQTGVISDQFLPLDGVLYYHMVRQNMGVQDYSMPGESNIKHGAGLNLPIKRSDPKDNAWFYAISFAQWPVDVVEDSTFYVKRFDLNLAEYVDRKTNKVITARGRYKAYHLNVYYRHALYIEWFCNGDKEELEKLLRFCTHLGKKSAQGWGSVLRWEVEPWPEDWSIRGPGNRLMRAVPVLGEGFMYGIRPSYWHPKHVFPCKMPG